MTQVAQIFQQGDELSLPLETIIWRYVPLHTLFFYLNGSVFIPSVAKLREKEPFEGDTYGDSAWLNSAFTRWYGEDVQNIEEWIFTNLCSDRDRHHIESNKTYPDAASIIFQKHYYEFLRRTRFAWCWFSSGYESAAMWSLYAHQGVAIRTTIEKLIGVIEKTDRAFIYGKMTYVDSRNPFDPRFNPERNSDLLVRPFFLKRMEYQHENEIRFVTASTRDDSEGVVLRGIDPKEWISAIRLWPTATDEEEESIRKTVGYYLQECDCSRSALCSNSQSSLCKTIASRAAQRIGISYNDGIPGSLKRL